jgi:curli biogenesis system outer membrane secretion channel CsgG
VIRIGKIIIGGVALALIFSACASTGGAPAGPQIQGTPVMDIPDPPAEKQLVAIAGFQNKSTYSADKLWDTSGQMLMTELLRTNYFRLVEWAEMKRLFDWEALSTCSLVKNPKDMTEAKKILNCEYFISGTITKFDVNVSGRTSAMSKKKTFDTSIRVDLLLQDAATGEYLSQGIGESSVVQTLSGGLAGGQTGMWDTASANSGLERAIRSALSQLIRNYADR